MNSRAAKCLFAMLALLTLWSLPATAVAQQWPELADVPEVQKSSTNDVAVIVAVEDYAFLPDVPGATKNAADWERFLSDGLGVETVMMLTNQQAVREEILAFAEKAAAVATEDSTVWFVFIGHGAPNKSGDDGLLIGADGQQNAKSMSARGLPQRQLLAALESGPQARTIALIDACFSGRDASGDALAKGTMPVLPVSAAPAVAANTVVMTAATADEFAGDLPGADRPAFSYLVLGAMRGWADDGDGEVTVDEAVTFARRELLRFAGRQQTPQLIGPTETVLTRGAAESFRATIAPDAEPPTVATSPAPEEGVTATVRAPTKEEVDGRADRQFFAHAELGPALNAFAGSPALGFGLTGGAGVRIWREVRLGALIGLANPADPGVPSSPTPLPSDRGGEVLVDSNTANKSHRMGGLAAATVGVAIRDEAAGRQDYVYSFEYVVGGFFGQQCDGYQVDSAKGGGINCVSTRAHTGLAMGTRFSATFGFISLGATFAYRPTAGPDGDFLALIGLGGTYDD